MSSVPETAAVRVDQYAILQRSVWVTTTFVAHHHWPTATIGRAYLGARHRHRFGVRVQVSVSHGDREVEFHDLLDVVQAHTKQWEAMGNLGEMSCEQMAEAIAGAVARRWPQRVYDVTVDEDGECGATIRLAYDDIPF